MSKGNWSGLCLIWLTRGTWGCGYCLPPKSTNVGFGTICMRRRWSDHLDVDRTSWVFPWEPQRSCLTPPVGGKKLDSSLRAYVSTCVRVEEEGDQWLFPFLFQIYVGRKVCVRKSNSGPGEGRCPPWCKFKYWNCECYAWLQGIGSIQV